jgi:hypothetical protein
MVEKSKILRADVRCENGLIHEVDTVLLPPGVSLDHLAAASPPPAPAPAPATNDDDTVSPPPTDTNAAPSPELPPSADPNATNAVAPPAAP